jgi:hypothetical protein
VAQTSKDDVKKHFREEQSKHLQQTVSKYKQQRERVKATAKDNPMLPLKERIANSGQILVQVLLLTQSWNEVMPYIRKIRSLIDDVLGQNRVVACYLLFGKFSQSVDAIFMLLKSGFNYEAMELVRSNREALDLIHWFINEPEGSPKIKKWFAGEIINNDEARKSLDKSLKTEAQGTGFTVSVEGLKSGLYGVLSKYSHVSYAALLESYDVYSQGFDFDRIAGHHFALNSATPYFRTELHGAIIALKAFYRSAGDSETYRALDTLLRKYAPEYYNEVGRKQRHAELAARFKKP